MGRFDDNDWNSGDFDLFDLDIMLLDQFLFALFELSREGVSNALYAAGHGEEAG
jgi:hypothetical protein